MMKGGTRSARFTDVRPGPDPAVADRLGQVRVREIGNPLLAPTHIFQNEELDAPQDEYDCLIPGIYRRLRAGAGEHERLAFLEHELIEHFGQRVRPQADRRFAGDLGSWWTQRSQRQTEE